jgi:glycosyltransferase involved in cell wall biosynthesis
LIEKSRALADESLWDAEVAVIIPCFNEASAIAGVVADFREALPASKIYVYDNNSADKTVSEAKGAGAILRSEARQGKGQVIARALADVDADVYVIVDGDGTYDASSARELVVHLLSNGLDFVNGARVSGDPKSYRAGHRFGNWLLSNAVGVIFNRGVRDMLSGLKVMSRRFVRSFPCLSSGFEIETEITVHALELRMPLDELRVPYRERPDGSNSKLKTYRDGMRIARLIFKLVRVEKPVLFFGAISAVLTAVAAALGISLFREYQATGLVPRFPTAILATGMVLVAVVSAACGIILENVSLGRRESKRMVYLSVGPTPRRTANVRLES